MSTKEPSQTDHGEGYEEEHVHAVYEQIASHFSSTRYKVLLTSCSQGTQLISLSHGPL